jgi:hypothetical protein
VETACGIASFVLSLAAVAAFVSIVREALPLLDDEDRVELRKLATSTAHMWRDSVRQNRAVRHAWNAHVDGFPASRKRIIFAALLLVAFLSIMGCPVWIAVVGR